jgi:hypothetical protein
MLDEGRPQPVRKVSPGPQDRPQSRYELRKGSNWRRFCSALGNRILDEAGPVDPVRRIGPAHRSGSGDPGRVRGLNLLGGRVKRIGVGKAHCADESCQSWPAGQAEQEGFPPCRPDRGAGRAGDVRLSGVFG